MRLECAPVSTGEVLEKAGDAQGSGAELVKEEDKDITSTTTQTQNVSDSKTTTTTPTENATAVAEWANEIEMQRILDDMALMSGGTGMGLDLGLEMGIDALMDMGCRRPRPRDGHGYGLWDGRWVWDGRGRWRSGCRRRGGTVGRCGCRRVLSSSVRRVLGCVRCSYGLTLSPRLRLRAQARKEEGDAMCARFRAAARVRVLGPSFRLVPLAPYLFVVPPVIVVRWIDTPRILSYSAHISGLACIKTTSPPHPRAVMPSCLPAPLQTCTHTISISIYSRRCLLNRLSGSLCLGLFRWSLSRLISIIGSSSVSLRFNPGFSFSSPLFLRPLF